MAPDWASTVAEAVDPTLNWEPMAKPVELIEPEGNQEPPVVYWANPEVVESVVMAPPDPMETSRVLNPIT